MFTRAALLELHSLTQDSLARLFAHIASLPEEYMQRELAGFGMPTLAAQLAHTLACERYWSGVAFGHYERWSPLESPGMAELEAERLAVAAQTRAFIEAADDAALNAQCPLEGTPHEGEQVTPAVLLFHALTHHFHHKGQAVAMCRLLGQPAPDTDVAWD